MQTILITGTSKGLGHELARKYLADGCTVLGISRSVSTIDDVKYHHLIVDISTSQAVEAISGFLESLQIEHIDILINNAGTGSYGCSLSEVDEDEVLSQLNTHCLGCLRSVKASIKYLSNSKLVNVTSRLGSITQRCRGDFDGRDFSYSYRIAKCAQNMLSLCMASDPELKDNLVISVNPGLLKTDSGASDASHTASDGALAVISVIANAKSSGIYHAFGGEACY